jgi:hypothetical protein
MEPMYDNAHEAGVWVTGYNCPFCQHLYARNKPEKMETCANCNALLFRSEGEKDMFFRSRKNIVHRAINLFRDNKNVEINEDADVIGETEEGFRIKATVFVPRDPRDKPFRPQDKW